MQGGAGAERARAGRARARCGGGGAAAKCLFKRPPFRVTAGLDLGGFLFWIQARRVPLADASILNRILERFGFDSGNYARPNLQNIQTIQFI